MDLKRKSVNFISSFMASPLHTVAGAARRYLYKIRLPDRVGRVRSLVRKKPLVLQVETTNICNALCVFCAYPSMKRKKGVMSLPLFEKIVQEYAVMGGGAFSFTPVVGDALLDPHLLERLRLLEQFPVIDQVSMTTNGIALENYSDDEVRTLLKAFSCIQVSIGGLDRECYRSQYGVDRFQAVHKGMERLIRLRVGIDQPARLIFAFRTDDWVFPLRFRKELAGYRRQGVHIGHIWNYDNYSGVVNALEHPQLVIKGNAPEKPLPCAYPCIHLAICWDGKITACGCVDFEGDKLPLGNILNQTVAEVWSGTQHAGILASFPKGRLLPVCRECSAYRPDTLFAQPCFEHVLPGKPLPQEFYQEFWGG
jgi:Radical SAM superfamily/Iron-sulfur cluster-binding domain